MAGFWLSPEVLEGLGSSGSFVGTISTYRGTYNLYRGNHGGGPDTRVDAGAIVWVMCPLYFCRPCWALQKD